MNSIQLHQKANELVQIIGSRDIRNITRSLGMQVSEMPFDSILGFFTFQWEFHQVVINDKLDKATKQMVCGYALSRYADAYLFASKGTFCKMNYISHAHLSDYKANAFSSHLMLDSDEVYHLTTLGYDAAQIAHQTKRHLNLILFKLLEMDQMGFDMSHYYRIHRQFLKGHQHLAHLGFQNI